MKIRVGSLIQCLIDNDIGIVVGVESTAANGLNVVVWWVRENYKYGHGATRFLFEPDGDTEVVLRY